MSKIDTGWLQAICNVMAFGALNKNRGVYISKGRGDRANLCLFDDAFMGRSVTLEGQTTDAWIDMFNEIPHENVVSKVELEKAFAKIKEDYGREEFLDLMFNADRVEERDKVIKEYKENAEFISNN